jgi:nucleotide-binding universal stress UspA family protein
LPNPTDEMSTESKDILPLTKVLVATDGSKNAQRAVRAAVQVSKQFKAELILLNVVMELVPPVYSPIGVDVPTIDYTAYLQRAEADGKKIAADAAQHADSEGVKNEVVVLRSVTSVAEAILEEATKEKVNLIVVGTRGLGGFKKLLLGSVSTAIVDHAPCSVLVIR